MKSVVMLSTAFLSLLLQLQIAWSAELEGKIRASSKWGSGWIDLSRPTAFGRGEKLRLTIGGTAEKIVVRLLPQHASPDLPIGVVGVFDVPSTKIVELTINSPSNNIVHISVHGSENPWRQYPLGSGNGPATLERVERIDVK